MSKTTKGRGKYAKRSTMYAKKKYPVYRQPTTTKYKYYHFKQVTLGTVIQSATGAGTGGSLTFRLDQLP